METTKILHLFDYLTTLALTGEYLLNETRYRQSGKCVGKYKGHQHCPKIVWTLVHKRLKNGTGDFKHRRYFVLSHTL